MKLLAVMLLVLAQPLAAQVRPMPGAGDARLQTVPYDPDQVVELSIVNGYQLMVRFASGEVVETISVGDSTAWQVTASKRGDLVFVKNLQANSVTNMTIVTDARIYNFELAPANGYAGVPAYRVSFVYPEPVKTSVEQAALGEFEYRLRGARAVRPSRIYFDGSATVIEWPPDQPIPAVFELDGSQESLVNGEMRDGHFVVQGAPKKLVFRLGKLTAEAIRARPRRRGR
jgi:type IV secretion system protein VirB9